MKKHALFNRVNGFLPYFTKFSQNFYPILHNFRKHFTLFYTIFAKFLQRSVATYVHKNLLSDGDFRKNRRSEIHIYDCK
jgi:hypothetical protein